MGTIFFQSVCVHIHKSVAATTYRKASAIGDHQLSSILEIRLRLTRNGLGMYQCRCMHWNTDTDSTDTDLTDGTDTLRSVSLMTLKYRDQCHWWHWHTEISVTDDTETLRPVSPLSLTHWDQCHRWRWNTEIGVTDDILTTHWNIPRWLGMYPCLYALKHWHWHTEIQCFSVVGDTDLSVSVSWVTPISVFQCRRWRWSQCFSVTDDTDLSVPVSLMTLISVSPTRLMSVSLVVSIPTLIHPYR
jgi:hypothetical protein